VNSAQAKQILLLHRPGTRDAEDPEIIEAMELARKDPELGKWFAQHQAFQLAMRAKFREIEVPEHLKRTLLASQKVVRPIMFWQRPVWSAAAAIFLALLGLAVFWLRPSVPDRFRHYRESMVSAAVRMYGMDLVTSDGAQLRQFVATNGAPADYYLTQGLAKLPLKGGGLLRWRGNPVSMVCFNRAGTTLFLFVMKRSALKDPPPPLTAKAKVAQVDGLMTASWTRGEDTYVLAGPDEPGFAEKYLTAP
jgi:uncharacterized membrane protein YbaN (DUF454 family)